MDTYYLLIYLLTPWSRVLLEQLTGSQPVKKFPAFYETRKFITAFTSAHYLSLFWARSIQSMPPHPTSWRSIFVFSSHQRLGLPSGVFPSDFLTKTCIHFPLSIHATCPAHLILIDLEWTRTTQNVSDKTCNFVFSHRCCRPTGSIGPTKTGHTCVLYTKSYVSSILISQEGVLFVRYRFPAEVINFILSKMSWWVVHSTGTEGVKQPEW